MMRVPFTRPPCGDTDCKLHGVPWFIHIVALPCAVMIKTRACPLPPQS